MQINKINYSVIIPKLSKEIHFNILSDDEIVVSNRKDKHYLKVNKILYTILILIDGKRDLKAIISLFNLKNNFNISENDLHTLLYEKLSVYGLIEGEEAYIKKYKKPSYLNLSFIIINEKILNKFVKYFHFLFKPKFAIFLVAICLVSIIYLLINNFKLYENFNLQISLLYFFILMAISVTFHEIGHATAANYFGAKHGGIGGGFYLFTPVYYADVTDVWRLPKYQRIIVNVAGMYFELIFCTIIAIISFILNNNSLLVLSIIVCIKTLFNLNPFLRSDGYWILSDLTNKPNLFYHATSKFKDIHNYFVNGKKIKWNIIDLTLLVYAIISYFFISMFLFYVIIKNPNSILYFPQNLLYFMKSIFDKETSFNLVKYGELIIPIIFLMLVFNFLKSIIMKYFS